VLREWHRAAGEGAIYAAPAPHGNGRIAREAIEKFYRRTPELSGKHSPHSWRSASSTWGRDAGLGGRPKLDANQHGAKAQELNVSMAELIPKPYQGVVSWTSDLSVETRWTSAVGSN
jgi:hypothetical protein